MAEPEFFRQATMPCWPVFRDIMTAAERQRECEYRYAERVAILRDGDRGAATMTQHLHGYFEAAVMREQISVWLL